MQGCIYLACMQLTIDHNAGTASENLRIYWMP
jgi:hypothetical protein